MLLNYRLLTCNYRQLTPKLLLYLLAAVGLFGLSWLTPRASQAQSASANSAANSAGTTVNNQNNSQINTSTFYGFGPGINCPTPTLAIAGFSGNGSGSSDGDVLGAAVSSNNYGGIVTFTLPIGGTNAEICKEIGKAQVQALMANVARGTIEANKVQADINLVTAIKCVELMRVATLSGVYAEICRGVTPIGQKPLPPTASQAAPLPGQAGLIRPMPPRASPTPLSAITPNQKLSSASEGAR